MSSPANAPFRFVRSRPDGGGVAIVAGEACDFVRSVAPAEAVDRTGGVTTVTLDAHGIRRLDHVAGLVGPGDPRAAAAGIVRDGLREVLRKHHGATAGRSGTGSEDGADE